MAKKGFAYLRQHHVGLLALFIAMSGTAYAASLPRNSVGTAQLKKNAVTSAKVKDHSLLRKDFKAGQLPSGPQGPRGLTGATGPQGTPGRNGATNVIIRTSPPRDVAPGDTAGALVDCQGGEYAVGGGGLAGDIATLVSSVPMAAPGGTQPIAWTVGYRNDDPTLTDTVRAYAVCASP
jgi:hypothetical protein